MGHSQGAMKNVYAKTTVKIPDGVTVDIKSRAVVVKGPRGTLSKNSNHIQNMIIGVTKGFKYRMKMVYAHFPTNAQIAGDGKSVDMVNFIGQKVKFHVDAHEGVKIERDPKANTELLISGNDIESVPRPVPSSTRVAKWRGRISVSSLMVST